MTKDELINNFRDINVYHEYWYEGVYEWFIKHCEERGIEVVEKDITWSGFWSQGDGAAFAGRVVDFKKLLGDRYVDYPIFSKYVEELNGYARMSWRTGNYNNVRLNDIDVEFIGHYLDNDHPFVEVWQEQLDKEVDMVYELVGDEVNDLCGLLYDTLRDEYEHLTSDEAVWDTIQANDLDKEVA
jgi:hypothetical protein